MNPSKRDVLFALAALAGAVATPALAQQRVDLSAGRAIGQAYLAAHPGADIATFRRELLPNGFSPSAAQSLRGRVGADFRAARVFVYRGWRLSETEARLFALLA